MNPLGNKLIFCFGFRDRHDDGDGDDDGDDDDDDDHLGKNDILLWLETDSCCNTRCSQSFVGHLSYLQKNQVQK